MSDRLEKERISEVLRLIDQGKGYSNATEFERDRCIKMRLAEEIKVDNEPLLRLTEVGMMFLDLWTELAEKNKNRERRECKKECCK